MGLKHPRDDFGMDRVKLRQTLDEMREMTDAEVVEALLEHPVIGLSPYADVNEAQIVLRAAVKDERATMALGDALGPSADPRYLARTLDGRASKREFFRQLDELAEQTAALADTSRNLRDRFKARMGADPTDDDPVGELRLLIHSLECALANAALLRFAMRRVPGGLPPWDDDGDAESWEPGT